MDGELRAALAASVANVFSQIEQVSAPGADRSEDYAGEEFVAASISISGDWSGRLVLMATGTCCQRLLMRIYLAENTNQELIQDATCETLNMVAESTRTLVHQAGGQMDLGVLTPVPAPAPDEIPADALGLAELGERIYLWLEEERAT